ncbi:dehydrogenase, partial [Mycolicibacterium phlei]|nr:dehydrogenase [Mycolicibacterium phlei]
MRSGSASIGTTESPAPRRSMSAFTDRTLVVSGGSRGIGLAIALAAA